MAGAVSAPGTNAMGLDANALFTRGTGDDKPRGESMVQKHLEKLQQEKEALAIEKLSGLMPQLSPQTRVLALKEAVFDLETALGLLRAFQTQHDEALRTLHKKQRKLKEAEAEAVKKAEDAAAAAAATAAAAEEASSSGSESGSGSSGSESEGRKRRSSKKGRSSRHSKKGSSNKDKKKRSGKKEKRDSGKVAKAQPLTASEQFGRFGIIRETDAFAKRSEFTRWAMEVRKQDVELLGRVEERELFRDYMEDFNTGTLPHRKYYNLEIYEREKAAKRAAKHGGKAAAAAAAPPKVSALDDERALRREREAERARLAEERKQQALAELQGTDKARDMREQEMLRLQMQAAYKTGDKRKADAIFKQLMTDDEKVAKGIMKPKKKP